MKWLILLLSLNLTYASAGSFTDTVGTHYSTSWTATVRTPTNVSDAINTTLSYPDNYALFAATAPNLPLLYSTVVLQVFGGREATNVAAFLNAIQADQGVGYRAHMEAKASLVKGMGNVYWQVGNEINNGPKLSPSIHAWLGDGQVGGSNDLTILPTYVEMWLAPAVQGLQEGDPSAQILIGSVVGASTGSQSFTAALLDYQITGVYAPALAGKYVREIVKVGSIHYSLGSTDWQKTIDLYTSRGLAVWSTEEVGVSAAEKGLCMPKMLQAIGRSLSYNPEGRVFTWGSNIGANSCNQWMPTLTAFVGVEPLSTSSDVIVNGTGLESYQFSLGTTAKRMVFIQTQAGSLSSVSGNGVVYVFRASGVEQYTLPLTTSVSLDLLSTVVVLLN